MIEGQRRKLTGRIKKIMCEVKADTQMESIRKVVKYSCRVRQEKTPKKGVVTKMAEFKKTLKLENSFGISESDSSFNESVQTPPRLDVRSITTNNVQKLDFTEKESSVPRPENLESPFTSPNIKQRTNTSKTSTPNNSYVLNVTHSEFSFKSAKDFSLEGEETFLSLEVSPVQETFLSGSSSARSLNKFPRSIKSRIQFFESKASATIKKNKIATSNRPQQEKKPIKYEDSEGELIQYKTVNNVVTEKTLRKEDHQKDDIVVKEEDSKSNWVRHRPVITDMILKQSVIQQLMNLQKSKCDATEKSTTHTTFSEIPKPDVIQNPATILETIEFLQEQVKRQQSSIQFLKNKESPKKFVVNFYEPKPKMSQKCTKVKATVEGGLIKVNTMLHIKEMSRVGDLDNTSNESSKPVNSETFDFEKLKNESSHLPHLDNSTATYTVNKSIEGRTARPNTPTSEFEGSSTILNCDVDDLMKEVHHQCHIMQQATKAVETCTTIKELVNGEEQLEAERILLLAGLKRELLLQEIRKSTYEGNSAKMDFINGGSRLKISDMEFPLSALKGNQHCKTLFIITCSSGSVLQASQIIEPKARSLFLNVPDTFVFENLKPNFVINLKVYEVEMRNNAMDDQPRIARFCCINKMETSCCRRTRTIQYKDIYSGMATQSEVLPPVFTLCGSLDITMENVLKNKAFILQSIPQDSTLFGVVKFASILTNTSTNVNRCGFLTVGTRSQDCTVWNRRWCRLEGKLLRFWSDPCEDGLNEPALSLDLQHRSLEEIKLADKDVCSRPRTLYVEIAKTHSLDSALVMTEYFLSADNSRDFKMWKDSLNAVVSFHQF